MSESDATGAGRGRHPTSARQVSIRQGDPINAPALTAMLREIVANNRAGGWRKLKQRSEKQAAQ